MKSQNKMLVFVLISLILGIVSCLTVEESTLPTEPTIETIPTSSSTPPVIDTGLAYGIPCKPPCWQELTPGKVTRQETIQVIEKLFTSKQVDSIQKGSTGFVVYPVDSLRGVVLGRFEGDVLKSINSQVEFYYSVGSLLKQFGNPERLYKIGGIDPISGRSCNEWQPPQPITAPVESIPVHLLYPQQGLYFLMLQKGGGYICPEMEVTSFCYYEPLSMSEALKDDYLANLCSIEGLKGFNESYLVEWHGFGGGY